MRFNENSKLKSDVFGYPIFSIGKNACIDEIVSCIESQETQARWLACINPHSYVVALRNSNFSQALRNADWLIPDGMGIVLGSNFLGGKIAERVTGSDIFYGVMRYLDINGGSIFLMGSTDETLRILCDRIRKDFPGVQIAGTYSPPFKPFFLDSDTDEMLSRINTVKPNVLWVGMTSPKQDLWINSNKDTLNVSFVAGVGAVFDFYSGKVRRSHPFFQSYGLEWLPRLLQQPCRLWPRTFISGPVFIWNLFVKKFKQTYRGY